MYLQVKFSNNRCGMEGLDDEASSQYRYKKNKGYAVSAMMQQSCRKRRWLIANKGDMAGLEDAFVGRL